MCLFLVKKMFMCLYHPMLVSAHSSPNKGASILEILCCLLFPLSYCSPTLRCTDSFRSWIEWFTCHNRCLDLLASQFGINWLHCMSFDVYEMFHRIYVASKAVICGYCSKKGGKTGPTTASICTTTCRANRTSSYVSWWISSFLLPSPRCCSSNAYTTWADVSGSRCEAGLED